MEIIYVRNYAWLLLDGSLGNMGQQISSPCRSQDGAGRELLKECPKHKILDSLLKAYRYTQILVGRPSAIVSADYLPEDHQSSPRPTSPHVSFFFVQIMTELCLIYSFYNQSLLMVKLAI